MNTSSLYRAMTTKYEVSLCFAYRWGRGADWNFNSYCIPAPTFWYILEGKRMLVLEDSVHMVEPGCLVALAPNTIVSTTYAAEKRKPIRYLSIGIQAVMGGMPWMNVYGIPTVIQLPHSKECKELISVWADLVEMSHKHPEASPEGTDSSLSACLAAYALVWESAVTRWLSLLTQIVPPYMATPVPIGDTRVRELCAFMRANYTRSISSVDLARRVYLSQGHMRALFVRVMGMSPHQYMLHVRLEKAKELLAASSLPLTELAREVGIESLSYFSRMFRSRVGMAPAEYRKCSRKTSTE